MSRIRRNIEYYRLTTAVETDGLSGSGSENVFNTYNSVDQEDGENLEFHDGVNAVGGYQQFPNGTQMIWGRSAAFMNNQSVGVGTTLAITFSYSFVTCYNVVVTLVSDGDTTDHAETSFGLTSYTNTGCVVRYSRISGTNDSANMRFHYQAFGSWV